jgi:hypothetical protein
LTTASKLARNLEVKTGIEVAPKTVICVKHTLAEDNCPSHRQSWQQVPAYVERLKGADAQGPYKVSYHLTDARPVYGMLIG